MRRMKGPVPVYPDGCTPRYEVTAVAVRATRRVYQGTDDFTLPLNDTRDVEALVPAVALAFGAKHLESREIARELVRLRDERISS